MKSLPRKNKRRSRRDVKVPRQRSDSLDAPSVFVEGVDLRAPKIGGSEVRTLTNLYVSYWRHADKSSVTEVLRIGDDVYVHCAEGADVGVPKRLTGAKPDEAFPLRLRMLRFLGVK